MTMYIAIIDYKATEKSGFDHIALESKNLVSAMAEAEKYMNDNVYMVEITEKSGKSQKISDYKETLFVEVLTNRGNGWHPCDDDHCESPSIWKMVQSKYGTWYEIA